jgi:hypothetical protein
MLKQSIPAGHLIWSSTEDELENSIDFVNVDSNSDFYTLHNYLRFNDDCNKVRLILTSGILAYPAMEMCWKFKKNEYKTARTTFFAVNYIIEQVKEQFDKSMAPITTLAPMLKEACKDTFPDQLEKHFMLPLDELSNIRQSADWRSSLYSNRYPNMTKEEKNRIKKYHGNVIDTTNIIKYETRGKYPKT